MILLIKSRVNKTGHLSETAGAKTPSQAFIWEGLRNCGEPIIVKGSQIKRPWDGENMLTGFSNIIGRVDLTLGKMRSHRNVLCKDVNLLNLCYCKIEY